MNPGLIVGHGVGVIDDLPVPAWLFYYGATLVLVVSFVALGVLWTRPRLAGARERPLAPALQKVMLSPWLRGIFGALSFALLVLVVVAGLIGKDSPDLNIAPNFVYVVFWLGVPLLSVLLGNVWAVLNPWRAAADAVAWTGLRWQPPLRYPERLGQWPAVGLLAAFVALELAYTNPASSRSVAIATLVYSWITWTGAATFGRRAWFENGDGFSAYFGLFARMAPLARREGELFIRLPLTGVAKWSDPRPGTLGLVAVALGSVAFDGLSRTNDWEDLVHARSDAFAMTANLLGLGVLFALAALAYLVAIAVAQRLSGRRDLAAEFLGSLVPIAFAYLIAHYFSLFVFRGQILIPLVSDPFGFDWNLFGTIYFRPDYTIITPELTWYVQVSALVVGHVLGLVLAHDRALSLFSTVRSALRTQYAMLGLMVLYTVGGMWLLSRP